MPFLLRPGQQHPSNPGSGTISSWSIANYFTIARLSGTHGMGAKMVFMLLSTIIGSPNLTVVGWQPWKH